MSRPFTHPRLSRRTMIQAGAVGLLGLGMNHLAPLRQAGAAAGGKRTKAKSIIYIFLSGGLAQQDSFDPKPSAPANTRGEFQPIATKTPGVQICEHLPLLAACSDKWALVRSLTHPYNEHSNGHMVMLSGRTPMPPAFDPGKPRPADWPSIAAVAGDALLPANNLPPAVVLPERLVHRTGRVIPGQFAGVMGNHRDPWFIAASPFNGKTYGAYPEFEFHHETGKADSKLPFQAPNLSLPSGLSVQRLTDRIALRGMLDRQRGELETAAQVERLDRDRQNAISLLSDSRTQAAFDVSRADEKTQQRYGKNSFGRSLLMARQLVEQGVALVQVNLGNNESWDTHESAFPNLKNFLLPPTDRAVSALIGDLDERGLLDDTLIVMAGEFGRTPRVFAGAGKLPGRDHWGAVQTVFFAGGGVKGGAVIGSSDRIGGYPASDPQTAEQMAATIYNALGIPDTAAWQDEANRPHHIYHGTPIVGLT
ncbi:MAG: DUF1501 domain-containing protein [Pirellulaceae bacterium]